MGLERNSLLVVVNTTLNVHRILGHDTRATGWSLLTPAARINTAFAQHIVNSCVARFRCVEEP